MVPKLAKKQIALKVLVTTKEHTAIKAKAVAENRSVSSWVGLLVRKALAEGSK